MEARIREELFNLGIRSNRKGYVYIVDIMSNLDSALAIGDAVKKVAEKYSKSKDSIGSAVRMLLRRQIIALRHGRIMTVSRQEVLSQQCITDVRRMPMSSIKRIIKLNRNRQRAIREKDFRKFYIFSCKIHLIERMDKVPIGSYILK